MVFLQIRFPKNIERQVTDKQGRICRITINIRQTDNLKKYGPDGISAVFKVIRETNEGELELVLLVDNHKPLGFHYHDRLPDNHDSRQIICAKNWQEAWDIFDEKVKELLK